MVIHRCTSLTAVCAHLALKIFLFVTVAMQFDSLAGEFECGLCKKAEQFEMKN